MNQARLSQDPFHGQTRGELMAVHIDDVPSPGRFDKHSLRIIADDLPVLVVADDLEHIEPESESDKAKSGQDGEEEQPAQMGGPDHGCGAL